MSYGMKFTTENIRHRKIEIFVGGSGKFNADIDGDNYEAPTLEALKATLNKATKSTVAIEFWRWHNQKLQRGVVIGVHAFNGNSLIKWDGKKGVDQEYTAHSREGRRYLRLTEEDRAQYTGLREILAKAEQAVTTFEQTHEFDPADQLKAD